MTAGRFEPFRKRDLARIKQAIESGVYADGDQLPAERQLPSPSARRARQFARCLTSMPKRASSCAGGSGTFVSYAGPIHQGWRTLRTWSARCN